MEDKAIKVIGLGAEAMEKYVGFRYYELWFNWGMFFFLVACFIGGFLICAWWFGS